jgi:hypothetical protein
VTASLIPFGDAVFSPCGKYRYRLDRFLGSDVPLVGIGLNPSTATAEKNDPTLRRDCHFTRAWGFGHFIKLNAYGFKATIPADMWSAKASGVDIVGPDNDEMIAKICAWAHSNGGRVWASWGGNIEIDRQRRIAELLLGIEVWCIKTNGDGTPVHELYQPNSSVLVPWRCP